MPPQKKPVYACAHLHQSNYHCNNCNPVITHLLVILLARESSPYYDERDNSPSKSHIVTYPENCCRTRPGHSLQVQHELISPLLIPLLFSTTIWILQQTSIELIKNDWLLLALFQTIKLFNKTCQTVIPALLHLRSTHGNLIYSSRVHDIQYPLYWSYSQIIQSC